VSIIYASMSVVAGDEPGKTCISCHEMITPGIVEQWKDSKHSKVGVKCIVCHGVLADEPGAIGHNQYTISPVVSPKVCGKCHPGETEEFMRSLHPLAGKYYELLYDKEKLPYLESEWPFDYQGLTEHDATLRGCQSCHGTNMSAAGPDYYSAEVWPNEGMGRINPDGTLGTCAACHTAHEFSVEEARKPEACGQCHLGPDHPQIEIYYESKHGAIYLTQGGSWNWTKDIWIAGIDYRAPTCASCHMSGVYDLDGNEKLPPTHDVSSRLSWELEPAISKRTDNTANIFGTEISDGSSWEEKRERMQMVCGQCHSPTWVNNYYQQADAAVELYNAQYTEVKKIEDELREKGYLTPESFDEPFEFKIYEFWHHEGRRARMGAFMMGPDYVQWHGFYELLRDKAELKAMADELMKGDEKPATNTPEQTPGFTALAAFLGVLLTIFILRRRGR